MSSARNVSLGHIRPNRIHVFTIFNTEVSRCLLYSIPSSLRGSSLRGTVSHGLITSVFHETVEEEKRGRKRFKILAHINARCQDKKAQVWNLELKPIPNLEFKRVCSITAILLFRFRNMHDVYAQPPVIT